MTGHQLALKFWQQGILLVPTGADKVPLVPYSHWRKACPQQQEYEKIWASHPNADVNILTGLAYNKGWPISVLDVDLKNDEGGTIVKDFEAELNFYDPELFAKLYIEETGSGGRHYAFKTLAPIPTRDIAYYEIKNFVPDPNLPFDKQLELIEKNRWRPVVEMQGQNAMCRAYPTKGFKVIQGDILDLKLLDDREVGIIQHVSKIFNKKPPEEIKEPAKKVWIEGEMPGNEYAANVSLTEICNLLTDQGWEYQQRYSRIYLRRPGAQTKGWDADIKDRVFMSHSYSVTDFEKGRGYNFFSVYGILQHGGDFTAAAKQLKAEGWGQRMEVAVATHKAASNGQMIEETPEEVAQQEERKNDLWGRLAETRVLISKPPKKIDFDIKWRDANKPGGGVYYNIASTDMIVLVSGQQKARKTSLVTSIIAAGICGEERAGFSGRLHPDDEIIWLDTEQAEFHSYQTARRIVIQSLLTEFPDTVYFYSMVDFDHKERLLQLDMISEKHPNAKIVVIDGIVDFVKDFNDIQEVGALAEKLKRFAKGKIIFPVMHINRGRGEANGHLGSRLEKICSVHIRVMLNDDDTSEVSFPDTRDQKPPAFSFSVTGPNIPIVEGYPKPNYDFTVGAVHGDSSMLIPTEEFTPPRVEPLDDLSIPRESLKLSDEELRDLYGS